MTVMKNISQLMKWVILRFSRPVSAFTFALVNGRAGRRDGMGQPATSLQLNAKKHGSNDRPKVMAAAPKL